MNKPFIKVLGAIVIVVIILFSVIAVITWQDIKEINNSVKKITEQPAAVRILSDTSAGTSPLTVNFKPLLLNVEDDVEYF